jgi:hypothetical protein
VLALAAASVVLFAGCSSPAAPAPTPGAFSTAALPADLSSALASLQPAGNGTSSLVSENALTSGDWAAITAGPATSDASGPAGPFTIVIAHRVNGTWQLARESDTSAFCAALAAAPADVVSADMRDYFSGCK